jgi:hypothetical protein
MVKPLVVSIKLSDLVSDCNKTSSEEQETQVGLIQGSVTFGSKLDIVNNSPVTSRKDIRTSDKPRISINAMTGEYAITYPAKLNETLF